MSSVMQQNGSRVALNGFWGDQLLMDRAYLVDLAHHLRLPELIRHLSGAIDSRLLDLSPGWVFRAFLSDFVRWTVPKPLAAPLRMERARRASARAPAWFSNRLRAIAASPPTRPAYAGLSRTSVHARNLAANIGSIYQVIGVASEALSAGFHGHESWMPMLDRELVQFVASIPGAVVTPDGRSRGLLRDAMDGTLPDEVRLRRSKADGGAVLSAALTAQMPAIESFLGGASVAATLDLMRPAGLSADLEGWAEAVRTSSDFEQGREVLQVVGLEAWARSFFSPAAQRSQHSRRRS
jgi:hypothetical protein